MKTPRRHADRGIRTPAEAHNRMDHALNTGHRRIYWWSVFPLFSLLPIPVVAVWESFSGRALGLAIGGIVFLNFGTALLYYFDKLCAETGRWRTGERSLQLAALCGGWAGAFVAQQVLRHKVAKPSFQFVFWTIVLAHQIVLLDFMRDFLWWRALVGES